MYIQNKSLGGIILILTLNGLTVSENACKDDIMDVMDHLKLSEYSVIILENTNTKDYIQSICHRFKGIIEMRINTDGGFKHYKAFIPDHNMNGTVHINTGSFNMEAQEANLLNALTVKRLIVGFLNKEEIINDCKWLDITDRLKC